MGLGAGPIASRYFEPSREDRARDEGSFGGSTGAASCFRPPRAGTFDLYWWQSSGLLVALGSQRSEGPGSCHHFASRVDGSFDSVRDGFMVGDL